MSLQAWRSTAYLILNFIFGIVWFVVVVVMVALTIGLSITVLSVIVGPATVNLWRAAARFERRRIRTFLRIEILPPYAIAVDSDFVPTPSTSQFPGLPRQNAREPASKPLPLPSFPAESVPRRFRRFVTDGAAWRELTFFLLLLPVCIVEFVLCVLLLALTIVLLPFAILLSPILLIGWIRDGARLRDCSWWSGIHW